MKLCKDCRNAERDAFNRVNDNMRCIRIVREETSLVTGRVIETRAINPCWIYRTPGNMTQAHCGPDAQFFIAR